MAFEICIKNGEIIAMKDAVMPVSSIEFAYGFGVYENVRVVRGKAVFLNEHIDRLFRSANVIGLAHELQEQTIAEWTETLIQKCGGDALNLKMLLIGARNATDVTLFILPLAPLFPEKKLYTRGASAVTVEYERYLPDAKTLNMLGSYLAYRKAKESGAYDALLVDRNGCIAEGTRTNFFVMKDRTIIGAPMEDILEGVTMRHVLAVAKKSGFTVKEQPIARNDLASFDGAFLTSTSSKIMPLVTIDDLTFVIPDAMKELMTAFDGFLDAAIGS